MAMMRHLIAGAVAAATLPPVSISAASEPIELQWEQLIPQGSASDGGIPLRMVQPGEWTLAPEAPGVVHDYDGARVRLPGYVVPLDFEATVVREFLLVPYVGACIHVPPPPPNQIVYVTSEQGVEIEGLFDPVWVTGTFDTAAISNELADVGYRIEAELVEPYE